MRYKTIIKTIAERQNRANIFEALPRVYFNFLQIVIMDNITGPIKQGFEPLNIFLIQNKGKGPPGGADSPETGLIPLPDYNRAVCKESKSIKQKLNQIIQYQFSNLFHN